MRQMLAPGRYVYTYGIFYPENNDIHLKPSS